MASRQQRIREERERQQKEAAARRQLPDRPLGAEAIDAIEQDIATFTQLPGVRQTLNFVGGAVNLVNEAVLEPARYAATDPSQMGSAQALAGTAILGAESLIEKSSRGGEMIAKALNVDPRIGKIIAGGAAEELLTLGAGKIAKGVGQVVDTLPPPGAGPQFAMAGGTPTPIYKNGSIKLEPLQITTEPRLRAPGMVQDVAQQPEFRGALDRRNQALTEVRENIARREAKGKTAAKYKKELAGKGSTLDYDPNDPIVFEKARYKVYDPLDPQRTAHQHHLFAKAQSYPFVEKMEQLIADGIADEDDLVNMFAWADMLDVTMGNTRKNMLDAPGRSHIAAAPGSTAFDKTRNIHALLQEFGLEISGKQVKNMVKDAKNAKNRLSIYHFK